MDTTRSRRLKMSLLALATVLFLSYGPQADAAAHAAALPPLVSTAMTASTRSAPASARSIRATPPFVANVGQFDSRVRFQMRSGDETLWLTDDAIWVTAVEGLPWTRQTPVPRGRAVPPGSFHGVNLKLTFPGQSAQARLVAADMLPGQVNYFLGRDPSTWRTGIPSYRTVRWESIYPGVTILLGERWRVLEDRHLPAAASAAMTLRVEGARALQVNDSGKVMADTDIGAVALPILADTTGAALRPSIQGNSVSFSPATSSRSLALSNLTDPADLLYSTFLGGTANDSSVAMAVGGDGSIYAVGHTSSSDFPITPGAFDTSYSFDDVFVSKLNSSGTSLIYSTFLGGSSVDTATALAIGADGSAYIAGYTDSSDFPTTPGALEPTFQGGVCFGLFCADAFVSKLNAAGNALTYSTYLGAAENDEIHAIALGPDGSTYVTGVTSSSGFPTTLGAFSTTYSGGTLYGGDTFIAKLNPAGSALEYSTFLGGTGDDIGEGIAVDSSGNLYVAGQTFSQDFPTTPGAFCTGTQPEDRCNPASGDAFVVELNSSGSALVYSTLLGGNNFDTAQAIALGADGSAYITGYTRSTDFPTTPAAFDTTCGSDGQCDAGNNNGYPAADTFVTHVNAGGTSLLYSTYLGGSGEDIGLSISVASDGSAYVGGYTYSSDFPGTSGAFSTVCGDCPTGSDGILTGLNSTGTALLYSTFLGGGGIDGIRDIALGGDGSVYVIGTTTSSDFPTTSGAFDTTLKGGGLTSDEFIARLWTVETPPSLTLNHAMGDIGSYFVVTGVHLPSYTTATVSVNNHVLTTTLPISTPVAFELNTTQANYGLYLISVQTASGLVAGGSFTLAQNNPIWSESCCLPLLTIPSGLGLIPVLNLAVIAR